ncbi:MAG: GNAT family N-acetyltransferase [Leptolyngbyaceae bacterium]|nr:GNAT family N-acetyltransferase [Leptolyngbyaceae bacterium]
MFEIAIALTDAEIQRCFPVMHQLRPHLVEAEFVQRVRQQEAQQYHLVRLEENGEVKAVSGFRLGDNLAWGRFLYVDDLVTQEGDRAKGYGRALFDWLVDYAKMHHCQQLHLDSGVQRFDAHRFYMNRGMVIRAHHFGLEL